MKRDTRLKPPVPLIINVEQLAERLFADAQTVTSYTTNIPFKLAPKEQKSQYLALATSLLEKYEKKKQAPVDRFATLAQKGRENATLELLSHLKESMAAEYPDYPKAVTDAFAQSLLVTLKDKEFAQKLIQINQEILEFEGQRKKLLASQTPYHTAPSTTQVTQWMSTLREHQTSNDQVIKFIEKTEKRISENLSIKTEHHLQNMGLKPLSYPIKIRTQKPRPHSEIQDIPESQMPLVEELTQKIKTRPAVPTNPLLAKIKYLLMGTPSTLLGEKPTPKKELLRNASHRNLKNGKAQLLQGTHSLENPFPQPPLTPSASPEI